MFRSNNIFTNQERKDLLYKSIPLVKHIPEHPAKQTRADLHYNLDFNLYHQIIMKRIKDMVFIDLKIVRSWINEDWGRKEDISWHNHDSFYSCVYYLKTIPFFNSGTLFKDYGFVRAKQNSLVLFPSHLVHGTPSYPFPFIKRYTLVMELILQ